MSGPVRNRAAGTALGDAAAGDHAARQALFRDLITPAVALALTAAGVVLWALALPLVDARAMTDVGLVSVLPPHVFVALGLVIAGFLAALYARPVGPLLLIPVVALVLILFATPSIVEPVAHISATWRHVGIVEYINRTHGVDASIDAYFNWPGFFAFSAFVADVAGVTSTIDFARWAPPVYDILFLLPVFLIARTLAADRRLVWTTVWLFSMANWVAQDYFSPQATTYLLYLVSIALLLSWFSARASAPVTAAGAGTVSGTLGRVRGALRLPPPIAQRGTPLQRILVLLVLVVIIAATVPSHQLTPFALFAAVGGLVVVRACTARGLPLLVLVMIAGWTIFMTVSFLAGHFGAVAGSVGKVDQNVSSSLGGRLHGSADHLIVVSTRVAVTAAFWLLALVGFVRRLRSGYRDLPVTVLAFAPFVLIGLQSYGGEILLRIYLFGLPFMAFFAAAAFFTVPKPRASWPVWLGLAVVSSALALGFLVSRYGNERTDYFTNNEVQAVAYVNKVAPDGALLVSLTRDYPRKFERYEQFRSAFVAEQPGWRRFDASEPGVRAGVAVVRRTMSEGVDPRLAYLIVTRSQIAYVETFSDVNPRALDLLLARLRASTAFRTVYANRDAFVLRLRDVGAR